MPVSSSAVHQSRSVSAVTQPAQAKPFNSIPGPKPLPVLGNIRLFVKNQHRLDDFIDESLKQYGRIVKMNLGILGSNKFVFVADPDVLEVVLRAEGKYPKRDTTFTPRVRWFYKQAGETISFGAEDGEVWKAGRIAANKQIMPRVINSYIDGLNPIYRRFTSHLRNIRDENQLVDISGLLLPTLTMEVTVKFVYGDDISLLENPTEDDTKLLNNVNSFFEGMGRLLAEPPVYKVIRNRFYQEFISAIKGAYSHGYKYANNMLGKVNSGDKPSEVQGMLEQWLRQKNISTDMAVSMSIGMLIAGIHTTGNQSIFLLYEMAKNPEAQEKLYEEIQTVLGDRPPTAEDLASMPYLKGCVMESFRMKSTAGGIIRVLKEDAVIHGYQVPAGVNLWYSTYTAGRSDKVFDEPSKFKPERWNRKEGPQQHPFALLPFGFGPRMCYGKRFAEMELKLLLAEVVRNFKLSTDLTNMHSRFNIVEQPVGAVPIYFTDRT